MSIHVVDSHTAGEPTRVVISGGPILSAASMAEAREQLAAHHDAFRRTVVNEPRGSDVLVGALLLPPSDPSCDVGVVFFNNVGYLNMCVHGTIGLFETLRYLERISAGQYRLETPVGLVTVDVSEAGDIRVENVVSYRCAADVAVDVPGYGTVRGDVAWGGNWFFLCHDHREQLTYDRVDQLTDVAWRIRLALERAGIRGNDDGEIDHIELFGPPSGPHADSRNFVLCPGKAYDRSPCGTGTSAKLACLYAEGRLREGEQWRQESIIGSLFIGSIQQRGEQVLPTIEGRAYVTSEARLMVDPRDPYQHGIGV